MAARIDKIFKRLEALRRPSAADLDLLVREALDVSRMGYAARALALVRRWRFEGANDPDLNVVEAVLTASNATSSAAHRLRALSSQDPAVAAVEVANCIYRGELTEAIELARAHAWFIDEAGAAEGLTFAIWALGMTAQYEQAAAIVEMWKRRHAATYPEQYQIILRIEAQVAQYQHQYTRELSLLKDANAICSSFGMDTARPFMEPYLAAAHAHVGDMEEAHRLTDGWETVQDADLGPLHGFRTKTLMEIALLEEDYAKAAHLGPRLIGFCEKLNSAPLISLAHFYNVLAAPRAGFGRALDAYRQVAFRYQMPHDLERFALLDRLVATSRVAREVRICVRTKRERTTAPLVRLWVPRMDWTGEDVYWDAVRGILLLRGKGPFSPVGHPVLSGILVALLGRDEFALPVPDLFEEVWKGCYRQLVHEGKVHVTIHRLRKWLNQQCEDCGRMIQVRDGVVRLAPELHVRVVSPATPLVDGEPARALDIPARILQCLQDGESVPPRVLAKRLGISRSSLTQAVRRLLADGRILRLGRGRATCYKVAQR